MAAKIGSTTETEIETEIVNETEEIEIETEIVARPLNIVESHEELIIMTEREGQEIDHAEDITETEIEIETDTEFQGILILSTNYKLNSFKEFCIWLL